jgi:phospholipid/cholesterol/gamma-HCH transport system ATP-binding protein
MNGPIAMAEEEDRANYGAPARVPHAAPAEGSGLRRQLEPTTGLPPRPAVQRRLDRVMSILHTLPPDARQTILDSFTVTQRARYEAGIRGTQ